MLLKISMLAGSREPFIPNLTSCDALGCHAGWGRLAGPSPCRTTYVQKQPRDQETARGRLFVPHSLPQFVGLVSMIEFHSCRVDSPQLSSA